MVEFIRKLRSVGGYNFLAPYIIIQKFYVGVMIF